MVRERSSHMASCYVFVCWSIERERERDMYLLLPSTIALRVSQFSYRMDRFGGGFAVFDERLCLEMIFRCGDLQKENYKSVCK